MRHGLAAPVANPVGAADAVVALHASDPTSVHLAVRARCPTASVADVHAALCDERSLVRLHGMRQTLWVCAREVAAELQVACADRYAPAVRRRVQKLVDDDPTDHPGDLLDLVTAEALAAIAASPECLTSEVTVGSELLGTQLLVSQGKSYAGTLGLTSRLLSVLGMEGHIVRGRVAGSWLASSYTWSTPEHWLGEPVRRGLGEEEAASNLLRRYLARFGPATEVDAQWWTGWTKTQLRRSVEAVGAVEVDLDGTTGLVLADDLDPATEPGPWAALLPSLDPTTMGWKQRDWYLPSPDPAADGLFDRNGNAGATVWADGRVVGAWGQRPGGEVVTRLLVDVGAEVEALVEAEAERVTAWLDGTVVRARFPSPLQRELSG